MVFCSIKTRLERKSMKRSLNARPLVFPTPVWVIGTYCSDGRPNIMTAAWAGICCSNPPCIAVSLRKATLTYQNILARNAFTVNVPSEKHIAKADYAGMASGANVDKLEVAGLTAVKSALVDAPFVEEFPLIVECRVIHTLEIGLHTQFIGEILDVKADETVLNDQGLADISKVRPVVFAPEIRTYHGIGDCLGPAFSLGKTI